MRVSRVLAIAGAVVLLAGCGEQGRDSGSARNRSGIAGRVQVGPQCPVQTTEHPCADKPAAGSRVTVAKQLPGDSETGGEIVARATTSDHGTYRVSVAPGRYVVTTDAGMSCRPMDVRVLPGAYSEVDSRCDTGIR